MTIQDDMIVSEADKISWNRLPEILFKWDNYEIMKECDLAEVDFVLKFLQIKTSLFTGMRIVKDNG